ncbi:hypothetical protein [Arcticibacter tournemirensis]|uniref:Nucleotide-diphospho-sugar transferase domain-containing protein n=1 Tax=Arcticibacter tournemirensis TaxID=699437 RepID=A0A4V1KI13_9SPHI|nr:hypothetical protein [Arcticibacter tournemirensis]RXF69092.1 hypothetical protein EKH83_13130 [Arcticibacter tournemirensis]
MITTNKAHCSQKEIPLIFVHKGNTPYLSYALMHAYFFNKEADIFLLGDKSNCNVPYATHNFIDQYSASAKKFEKVYEHLSSNHYEYELLCLQRWFIINEFIKEKQIEHFLCLDSDVLLYCNVKDVFSDFLSCDFTICGGYTPNVTLFSNKSLEKFCGYLMDLYTNPVYLTRLRKCYRDFVDSQTPGGICDMTAFYHYQTDVSVNIKELSDIQNDYYFDANINESDGFETENGLKKIYWLNNIPYGKTEKEGTLIRFCALHFQGTSKRQIKDYLLNKRLQRPHWICLKVKSFFRRRKDRP